MKKLDRPLLGTVYLVEQQIPREQQLCDLENIAEAGLRLVVLWPPISRWDAPDGVSIAFDSITWASRRFWNWKARTPRSSSCRTISSSPNT